MKKHGYNILMYYFSICKVKSQVLFYAITIWFCYGFFSCNSNNKDEKHSRNKHNQPIENVLSTKNQMTIDSTITLVSSVDTKNIYSKSIKQDFDKNGTEDTIVLLADVVRDDMGRNLWSNFHIWQVYINDNNKIRHVYAQNINSGYVIVLYEEVNNKIYIQEIGPYRQNTYLVDPEQDFDISIVRTIPHNTSTLTLIGV